MYGYMTSGAWPTPALAGVLGSTRLAGEADRAPLAGAVMLAIRAGVGVASGVAACGGKAMYAVAGDAMVWPCW